MAHRLKLHEIATEIKAADTIADGGLHATLIVGEPQDVNRIGPGVVSALERFTISLACDGIVLEQGRGSNVLGSPLHAVAHLVAVIAKQPHVLPLQAGELVTTGTLTAALPIRVGQTWTTNFDGIALTGIQVTFEE